MTTIVYRNGVLAADRAAMVKFCTETEYRDQQKIFIAKNKTFAYGVSGSNIRDEDRGSFELSLFRALRKVNFGKSEGTFNNLQDELKAVIKGRHLIVMMVDCAMYLNGELGSVDLVRGNRPDDYLLTGSGADHAHMALLAGRSAVEAVQYATKMDIVSSVSKHLDTISRSDLVPVPTRKEIAEKFEQKEAKPKAKPRAPRKPKAAPVPKKPVVIS